MLARMRHEHEPLEVDPEAGGRLDAEVRHPDDSAPGARATRTEQQPKGGPLVESSTA